MTAPSGASPSPRRATRSGLGNNPEYAPAAYRLSYSSMVTPPTVYDYHPGRRTGWRRSRSSASPRATIPANMSTERIMVPDARRPADPGLDRLPARLRAERPGPALPLRLRRLRHRHAAGLQHQPHLSLLDRGYAFAIAHIRGGDDMGYQWYLDGKLDRRTNTFNDFVDAARGLIAQRLHARRPDRDPGRLGRRRADGRGGQSGDPSCGARWSPTCRSSTCVNTMLDETPAADPGRVERMGQSDHRRRPRSATC